MKNNHIFEYTEEEKERVKKALNIIGLKMENYAKISLTDSGAVDTGRLRNSITYATAEKHSEGSEPAKPEDYALRGSAKENSVSIGTNVEYAIFVEEGTSKMRKRPYIRPAIENHMDEWKSIIKNELKRE